MAPTTTERTVIHDARQLLQLRQSELDELFAASPVGRIPSGTGAGIPMIANRTLLGAFLRGIAPFLWKGKVFRPETADLMNRILPWGKLAIRARVYVDRSWKAPGDAIILDYSTTSVFARYVRDEIREVGPGIYLGKVFIGRKHLFDFSLTFR
jgi:hypothetical protein